MKHLLSWLGWSYLSTTEINKVENVHLSTMEINKVENLLLVSDKVTNSSVVWVGNADLLIFFHLLGFVFKNEALPTVVF